MMKSFLMLLAASVSLAMAQKLTSSGDVYQVGVGISDITGPAAEVNMMGYAKMSQTTAGIHLRLYSRAFILEDSNGQRIVYVVNDLGMVSQAVKIEVSTLLEQKYGGLYNTENVMLAGTHTHSGPGGYLQYVLYIITSQGFIWDNFDAIVGGIMQAIDNAHDNMKAARISLSIGTLSGASINRSPTAYLNNPDSERARYDSNTDNTVHQLNFVDMDGNPIGLLNWFAVHPTSMNNTNRLISSDNKGAAMQFIERQMNGEDVLPGTGPFVAGLANANLGDVSPNTKGPHCLDSGKPCAVSSTCDGQNEKCVAFGPGKDMFESTRIIANKQVDKAIDLMREGVPVSGPIRFIHQHVDMSNISVPLANGSTTTTCKPAMGYSFAAGTIDGPGEFSFKQGTTTPNAFWNLVRDFLSTPTQDMINCHQPKPILIATGQMKFPYLWQPKVLPTQVFQIGSVLLAGVPAEFTTMSGRRLKERLANIAKKHALDNSEVILSGLTNAYSSYVATFEEYQTQRYEGASTIFGPHTLDAYLQQFESLTAHLLNGTRVSSGPNPPNLLSKQISLKTPVIYDNVPLFSKFGEVLVEPEDVYTAGMSTVKVEFRAGHPRNNLMTRETFLTVERLDGPNVWTVVANDACWETKFTWNRTNSLLGYSKVTVGWDIPPQVTPGEYRIQHFGYHKNLVQQVKPYTGTSKQFHVLPAQLQPFYYF